MNPGSTPIQEHEKQSGDKNQPLAEIPAYPGSQSADFQPDQTENTSVNTTPIPEMPMPQRVPEQPAKTTEQANLYNAPEQVTIPQSRTPELQTNIAPETTRSGEKVFVNPELGQATFSGGVTSQQLVSRVAGYYTVQQGLISDPKSGLLQQTATTGDPSSATTWQATVIFKILQAFWNILGISA